MTRSEKDKLIAVGVLKGAHGVRGEVRVKSLTSAPEALFGYGPLLDEAGAIVLTPESARPGKDHFIVRPKEMRQKEEWDALRGRILHVPRSVLPEVGEGEFYVEDLAGLTVYSTGESPEGRVRAVQNFGSGDLLEIELTGQTSTIFVPFTQADVPVIDLAGRRIVVPDLALWASAES
ncbi:MAG: ribosome maturation factor RimM [Hyphomonas sp.]|jgi:16S rRNA processing protein RimM